MKLTITVPEEHAAKLTALAKSMRTTPQHIAQHEFVALWLAVKAQSLAPSVPKTRRTLRSIPGGKP